LAEKHDAKTYEPVRPSNPCKLDSDLQLSASKQGNKQMAKEVTKKNGTAVSIPDYMQRSTGRGTETLIPESLTPPRLKLAQALSPERAEMDTLKTGMFFNSITREIYTTPFTIVPARLFNSYILFAPRKAGGELLARADDGIHWMPNDLVYEHPLLKGVRWCTAKTVLESGLHTFGTSDPGDKSSPPAATFFVNVLCFVEGTQSPMIYSFARSSLAEGKRFAGGLRDDKVDCFGRKFQVTSVSKTGPTGDPYFEPRFTGVGFTEPDDYAYGETLYKLATTTGVKLEADENV